MNTIPFHPMLCIILTWQAEQDLAFEEIFHIISDMKNNVCGCREREKKKLLTLYFYYKHTDSNQGNKRFEWVEKTF